MSNYVTFPVMRRGNSRSMSWMDEGHIESMDSIERVIVRTDDNSPGIIQDLYSHLEQMALAETLLNTKAIQAKLQKHADDLAAQAKEKWIAEIYGQSFTVDAMQYKKFDDMAERRADRNRRNFSYEQVVTAMEHAVRDRGLAYRDMTAKTTTALYNGDRCIQGQMMVDLGIQDDEMPGSWAGVADIFGLRGDSVMEQALSRAQTMNDSEEAWGDILVQFKKDLGLAA